MKLPDIGVNDLLDKNSYSLNKMKGSAKEGLSGLIVDLLGISQKDVKEGSGPDKDGKKLQKTLDELLKVSKETEKHLQRISNLLVMGISPLGAGSARVNVSGVPGYSDIPRRAKRGASDIFRATATRQVIDRLRIPRDVKGASPSNWEVLDKEGNVIQKPTASKIPALPAPPTTTTMPSSETTPPQPEGGPGGLPIPPVGGRLGTAILRRAPILIGAAAADTALGMMGVGGKQINDDQDEENWNRMSTFQKAQSGFARGIEKVGTVFGMGNVANEARYNRVMSETNYFRDIDDAKGGPQSSTFVPKTEGEAALRGGGLSEDSQIFKPDAKGLSQVLDERNEPTLFSRIGSRIANIKNEIGFAYNRGTGETPGEQELDARMEDIIAAREKEGNPLERFSQEYNDIRNKIRKEIEAKNPQAFMQAEQKIGSQSQMRQTSSSSSEGVTNETELNKAITSSKSLFGSEFLGGLATKKGLTKEFSIGDTSLSTEKDGRFTNERSDVRARRVSGGFFGRDKYKVTLDGEDIDVDKQYYGQIKALLDAGKSKEAAALARHIRDQSPMSPGASSLPAALNQLSAENRDLGREETSAPVQPVIIQSNNNMASQNFVPTPAQPRSQSSFARIQERNAAYG